MKNKKFTVKPHSDVVNCLADGLGFDADTIYTISETVDGSIDANATNIELYWGKSKMS